MADDQPKKGGSRSKIVIAALAVLFLAAAGGAALFFTGALSHKTAGAKSHAKAAPEKRPPIYFAIDPALVVNFRNPTTARYLQVTVDVMARDAKVIAAVKANMPAIRNRLIILLSGQRYEDISTTAGKQTLRREVLDSINAVLKETGGHAAVEQVYFTSFVMQ